MAVDCVTRSLESWVVKRHASALSRRHSCMHALQQVLACHIDIFCPSARNHHQSLTEPTCTEKTRIELRNWGTTRRNTTKRAQTSKINQQAKAGRPRVAAIWRSIFSHTPTPPLPLLRITLLVSPLPPSVPDRFFSRIGLRRHATPFVTAPIQPST
ncbi:hypothetical protein LX32DRAFT_114129 [Colletotrichum zoysiae]|uniref:Uncharacterized protein n=1 Tax=Colletotrichum zoysiae TaxID=1216348 RepID=A0AAD9LVV1_9PEZI|nr:hypothetical protein LX32DRAFT_114129 [Colletotrichum zoysiae]